jgi:large subunit ribosomal protein L11
MADIKAIVKLQLAAAAATPAPPVGSSLGPHGINMMEFCKKFNEKTADKKGQIVPVVVTVFTDKKFEFIIKTPLTSELIKKAAKVSKGASKTKTEKIGVVSAKDVEEIAKIKMPDLNAMDLEEAKKIVEGTARSMGIEVAKAA